MKSAEEWLPFDLCSKKLAAVAKIWKSLFVQRFLKLPASWSHVEGMRIHSGTDYNCRLQNLSFAPMLEARSDTYISVRWWDNSYKLQRSGGHMFFHNLL
jgi:hypothetical protein